MRPIPRRVRPAPGGQLALIEIYTHHAVITNRDSEALVLEADHRRQSEIGNTIRGLKCAAHLHHLPSARFAAAGLVLAVVARSRTAG